MCLSSEKCEITGSEMSVFFNLLNAFSCSSSHFIYLLFSCLVNVNNELAKCEKILISLLW